MLRNNKKDTRKCKTPKWFPGKLVPLLLWQHAVENAPHQVALEMNQRMQINSKNKKIPKPVLSSHLPRECNGNE